MKTIIINWWIKLPCNAQISKLEDQTKTNLHAMMHKQTDEPKGEKGPNYGRQSQKPGQAHPYPQIQNDPES